jgi:hypothetical protein
MDCTKAARTVGDNLIAGGDEFAAAGAMYLALQAWRHLAGADKAWDRLGLELLDVRGRLYAGQDVVVEAAPPHDGPGTRAAVVALVEHLARHHEALAAGSGPLAQRLDHDAGVQQLRRAAAALASQSASGVRRPKPRCARPRPRWATSVRRPRTR